MRPAFEAFHCFPQLPDVGGVTDEGAGDVVGIALNGEREIDAVLLGQRGKIEPGAGEIDVAAGAHFAGRLHLANDPVILPGLDLHQHRAVVDHQRAAFDHVVHQAIVVDRGGKREGRGSGAFAELHQIADLQLVGFFQIAGSDRGPGQVEKDGDMDSAFRRRFADPAGHLPRPLVLRVAHVEPEHVGAEVDQLADGFL